MNKQIQTYFSWLKKYNVVFFVLLASTGYTAEIKAESTEYWSIQLENDLFGSRDDHFYTSGMKVDYTSREAPPAFMETITDHFPYYRKGGESAYRFGLGQKIFTPSNISQQALIEDDRPYAGWLFVDMGVAHMYQEENNISRFNSLIVSLGVIGPASLAEQTQSGMHRLTNSDSPRGWDNQLHNEPAINISYLRKARRLFLLNEPRQFELSHHAGLVLGNVHIYTNAGLMARWGTRLKNDIGAPTISPGFPGIPAFRPNPTFNWYIFTGIEGRLIARNIFLDGNTFTDSHSVEKKDFVSDVIIGIAFHYKEIRISISNMFRSKEFEGQLERTQFGTINLTIGIN